MGMVLWPHTKTCSDAVRNDDTPHALCSVPHPPCALLPRVYGWGSQLFFQGFLEQFLSQHLISKHPFETGVLFLKLFELLGLIDFEHPELPLPSVEGLLADLAFTADV